MSTVARRSASLSSFFVASTLTLAGCSFPYITQPPINRPEGASKALLNIDMAMTYLQDMRDKVEGARTQQTTISAVSSAGVMIGAAGAATSAVYGAHRDLITGFLLGGTGSLIAGQVYTERGYKAVYTQTIAALDCVDDRAREALAPYQSVVAIKSSLTEQSKDLETALVRAKAFNATASQRARTLLAEPIALAEKALKTANVAILAASLPETDFLAHKVKSAVDRIVNEANHQLSQLEPSVTSIAAATASFSAGSLRPQLQQLANAGASLRNVALSPSETAAAIEQAKKPAAGTSALIDPLSAIAGVEPGDIAQAGDLASELRDRIALLQRVADLMTLAATTAQPTTKTSMTECRVGGITIAPLTTFPTSPVVLTKGTPVDVSIYGGVPPYVVGWETKRPPDVSLNFSGGRTLTLTALGNAKAATYSLSIADTSGSAEAGVKTLDVKVE